MKIDTLFIILFLGAGFAFLYYALQKQLAKKNDEETLNKVVNQIFGMSANKIALQSRSILQGEKETIKTDLENKQKTFEKLVKQLQEDLQQEKADNEKEPEKKKPKNIINKCHRIFLWKHTTFLMNHLLPIHIRRLL